MRHLVESLVYRDMIVYLLETIKVKPQRINLKVNPGNISEIVGHKKNNIEYLKSKFFIDKIEISQDNSVEADTIVLVDEEKSINMSKKDYYSISTK
jgi:hypothetical protein